MMMAMMILLPVCLSFLFLPFFRFYFSYSVIRKSETLTDELFSAITYSGKKLCFLLLMELAANAEDSSAKALRNDITI